MESQSRLRSWPRCEEREQSRRDQAACGNHHEDSTCARYLAVNGRPGLLHLHPAARRHPGAVAADGAGCDVEDRHAPGEL